MSKKNEAIKVLTAKELIDPIVYLVGDYHGKTGLKPEEYYWIRQELAKSQNNKNQAIEAGELYGIFKE